MISYQTNGGSWNIENCTRLAISEQGLEFYGEYVSAGHYAIWFNQNYNTCETQLTTAFQNSYSTLKQNVLSDNGFTQVTTLQEQYLSWDNTLVKDSNNRLYRVHVTKNPYFRWKYVTSGDMVSTMKTLINSTSLTRSGDWGQEAFAVKYDNIEYTFSYEEVTDANAFNIDIQ